MKMMIKSAVTAIALVAACAASAETIEEAKALQEAALAEIKSKGLEGAAKEFNAGGKWRKGSLYVVVANFNGDMIAHSANDKIVGKNMLEAKDAGGRSFVKDAIAAAKAGNSGQFDMRWGNPVTKQIADATFLTRRVPGADAYVGTMIFK